MAITDYNHNVVDQDGLQAYLVAELAAGRWLIDGGEGLVAITDRGFAFSTNAKGPAPNQRQFEVTTWDDDRRGTPTAVRTYFSVKEGAEWNAVLASEAAANAPFGGTLLTRYAEWNLGGERFFDAIFYDFPT